MQASFLLQRELTKRMECGKIRSPYYYPHFHSHIEVYLILSGEVEVLVNDQKKLLHGGEIAVSLSYDTHGYRTPKEEEAIYLIIPTDFCKEFLPRLAERHLPSPYLSDPVLFQTVLDAMEKLLTGGNELTQRGLLYVILGAIFDQMVPNDKATQSPSHGFSAEILIYLSEHFREDITLSQVAREFGYTPTYLSRHFRKTFGISFVRYLTMLRLREAILLLRTGKQTVTSCAIDSGFGSMRSFYRAFYEEFGCGPKEYLTAQSNEMP